MNTCKWAFWFLGAILAALLAATMTICTAILGPFTFQSLGFGVREAYALTGGFLIVCGIVWVAPFQMMKEAEKH